MSASWRIEVGDAADVLRTLPAGSVQTCVTSPPYYGLRDYGTAEWAGGDADCEHAGIARPADAVEWDGNLEGTNDHRRVVGAPHRGGDPWRCRCGALRVDRQIGLESSVEEFVAALVDVFREVRRVLRDDGTLWVNLGDSYASRPGSAGGPGHNGFDRPYKRKVSRPRSPEPHGGIKAKDLIGAPWMLAFALRADGWYLRAENIWHKPCPMPESAGDRPTRAHEQVFLLSKSPRYYYDADAIREPLAAKTLTTYTAERLPNGGGELVKADNLARDMPERRPRLDSYGQPAGANKRTVWTVAPAPFPEAHFATYPPALVEPCILAGSSPTACGECGAPWTRDVERSGGLGRSFHDHSEELVRGHRGGSEARKGWESVRRETLGWKSTCEHDDPSGTSVVLDPFAGAGTTLMVALRHGRSALGIELNPGYLALARRRVIDDAPLLNAAAEDLAVPVEAAA